MPQTLVFLHRLGYVLSVPLSLTNSSIHSIFLIGDSNIQTLVFLHRLSIFLISTLIMAGAPVVLSLGDAREGAFANKFSPREPVPSNIPGISSDRQPGGGPAGIPNEYVPWCIWTRCC